MHRIFRHSISRLPAAIVMVSAAIPAWSASLAPAAQEAITAGKSADRTRDYHAAINHFRNALRAAPNALRSSSISAWRKARFPAAR